VPTMAAALVVQGFGLGLFQVAYTDLVIATLPPEERGVAGSLTMVTRTIGVVSAATGLSAAHRIVEGAAMAAGQSAADAFVAGFQTTFRGVAVALGLGLIFALISTRARPTP
jgi:MFS family permease